MKFEYLVGIDEAGRGPLAGPVTVGIVCIPVDFDWRLIPGVKDSKKLSEKKRETVFKHANELQAKGNLQYIVKSVSAVSIDNRGIAPAIRRAIAAGLTDLQLDPAHCFVKLDGALQAPPEYGQETIIKGDDKEPVIGLASIMAKVTRDRHMVEQGKKYPKYGLAKHKGYGTKAHREAIAKNGFTPIHRQSYCKNIKIL